MIKKYFTIATLYLTVLISNAQGYEFGIVHLSENTFKIVAIPDFSSGTTVTDINDVGFTLMLPAGSNDVINEVGLLGGRIWDIIEVPASTLQSFGGDNTKDAFLFNLPPGQTLLSHSNGEQIDLVSFEVSNNPDTGEMSFLLNSDPIAVNLGGVLDSFYNANIDETFTNDYFVSPASGLDTFVFEVVQGYEFGIVHLSDDMFKIVAIPNFSSGSTTTDVNDIGFTLLLPAGSNDVTNDIGLLGGRNWDITEITAASLQAVGGDTTEDAFLFNLPPGQTQFSHVNGEQIDLISFEVSNNPSIGEMRFLLNSDPIAINLGGSLNSFYNSNIDESVTNDYFIGVVLGQESFMFDDTLGTDDIEPLSDVYVFPNPNNTGHIFIKSKGQELNELNNISIFNINGQLVKEINSQFEDGINIANFPSGMYFLRVTGNNNLNETIKLIKE